MTNLVFVLDNSVSMRWALNDGSGANRRYADSILELLSLRDDIEALVPSLWWLEVGNVLIRAEKNQWIKRPDAERFLGMLGDLAIHTEVDSHLRLKELIIPLARKQRLTVYDATYLGVCIAHDLPLASLDQDLNRAAQRCGVTTLAI